MHVFDLIKRRRSIGKMTGERPTREQIERLLEAATHAPNHYKVQPWKFIVLAGNAREELVVAETPKQPKVMAIENIEATAAAVQNMLLTAEEMGLACMWRTGDAAYDPHVKQWLGLESGEHIVAFLYVGYPAIPRLERIPITFKEKTTWSGWEK